MDRRLKFTIYNFGCSSFGSNCLDGVHYMVLADISYAIANDIVRLVICTKCICICRLIS